MPDNKYEALYTELLDRGEKLHESNKKRISRGIIVLVILPFVLEFIRWMTDSDKVVFLIIWVFIMFIVSAYLISIEYLDSTIEGTLRDVTDTEAEFDGLLPRPELQEKIRERLAERRATIYREEERVGEEAVRVIEEIHEAEEAVHVIEEIHEAEEAVHVIEKIHEAEEAVHVIEEIHEAEDAVRVIEEIHEAEDAMKELRATGEAVSVATEGGPAQGKEDAK